MAPASADRLATRADRFLKLHLPTRSYPKTSWERAISEDYGWAAFHLGFALQGEGSKSNVARAEELYRTAIRYVPTIAAAYKNLGLLLHDNGGDPKEIASVWGRYLQLHPNDPQNPAIRAVLSQIAQGA
jgi:tetratricopeptide (TPR) repeat protein